MFSFIPLNFEKGSTIFKADDTASAMFIIQNGMVEIYTAMDNGIDFIIERLYRGSVINHRSFLLNDNIDVIARCATQVSLYCLPFEKMAGMYLPFTSLDLRSRSQ